MNEPQPTPGSWWQTLPGVLTALAGVITAISGLVALFYPHGSDAGRQGEATAATTPSPPPSPTSSPSPSPAPTPSTQQTGTATQVPAKPSPVVKAWSEAVAVVVGRDGRETRLRADSLSNCVSATHDLTLASGQSVDFERMASFEVQHADPHTASTAKARLQITLLDGGTVSDSVDANCDLFGFNDVGRFATFFDQIRVVRFER